jgi:hypothetical protein
VLAARAFPLLSSHNTRHVPSAAELAANNYCNGPIRWADRYGRDEQFTALRHDDAFSFEPHLSRSYFRLGKRRTMAA